LLMIEEIAQNIGQSHVRAGAGNGIFLKTVFRIDLQPTKKRCGSEGVG
jgi:hypothetical protein